jgi:photosystem II stability/assembly factor-like uncharacterized protein
MVMLAARPVFERVFTCLAFTLLTTILLPQASATDITQSELAPNASLSLLLDIDNAGDRLVAVGERGHILLSDDAGSSWRQVIAPTRSQLTSVFFADSSHGWAAGHDGVILHSADAGESWVMQHQDQQYDDPVLDIWFRNRREGFAIGAYGMFLSTSNGGRSWDRRSIIDEDFHFNAITALPDGEMFIAGEQGHLYHSIDEGYNWEKLPSPYAGSFFGITAIRDNSLLVYGLRGHLFRSQDRGRSWQPIDSGTEASLMDATQTSENNIFLVGLGGNILNSTDGGEHFSLRTRKDRKALTAVIEGNNGTLVISGAAGISVDSGTR